MPTPNTFKPRLREVSACLEMSRVEFFRQIALPSALPDIISGARISLAIALILMRRNNEAEPEARSAVAIDATNFKAHYVLGVLLARVPETRAQAIPHLIYAARFMPEGHQYLADVYRVNGEPELAQAELERYRAALARLAPKH